MFDVTTSPWNGGHGEGADVTCPRSSIYMTPRETRGLSLSSWPPRVRVPLGDGCKKSTFVTKVGRDVDSSRIDYLEFILLSILGGV